MDCKKLSPTVKDLCPSRCNMDILRALQCSRVKRWLSEMLWMCSLEAKPRNSVSCPFVCPDFWWVSPWFSSSEWADTHLKTKDTHVSAPDLPCFREHWKLPTLSLLFLLLPLANVLGRFYLALWIAGCISTASACQSSHWVELVSINHWNFGKSGVPVMAAQKREGETGIQELLQLGKEQR